MMSVLRFGNYARALLLLAAAVVWCAPPETRADVAVISNRTSNVVSFDLQSPGKTAQTMTVGVADARPVFFDKSVRIKYGHGLIDQSFALEPGSAYFFHSDRVTGGLKLEKIGLGQSDLEPARRKPWLPMSDSRLPVVTLPVKIAVDEDEATHRSIWEPRLRQRVEEASRVIEKHCGVQLNVTSVVTWDSDDKTRNFRQSLAEFEREVPRENARLVIGFSSQYELTVGRTHLGGSRGTLYPYILLKERAPNIMESERLQLLVHELGHFFGASHSPEPHSVMQPLLVRGPGRVVGSKIQFDPVNVLLMALVGDELHKPSVQSFADVSWETKTRMMEIYDTLHAALPRDPAAAQYKMMVENVSTGRARQLVRELLHELTQMAKREHARRVKFIDEQGEQNIPINWGDTLTARYVREAAAIGSEFDDADAARSMLIALGVFMDDGPVLRSLPLTRKLTAQLESEQDSQTRETVLGTPTMRGQRDAARHFFLSAYLTATLGGNAARAVGLTKEIFDATGDAAFSSRAMAANRAGIVFAEKVLNGEIPLDDLADNFRVELYLPEMAQPEDDSRPGHLHQRAGTDPVQQLNGELMEIERRVQQLPVYQQ